MSIAWESSLAERSRWHERQHRGMASSIEKQHGRQSADVASVPSKQSGKQTGRQSGKQRSQKTKVGHHPNQPEYTSPHIALYAGKRGDSEAG